MEKLLKKKWFAMLSAALCTVLWGSAYPVIKYGYQRLSIDTAADKLIFAGVRFLIAGLLVFAAAWIIRRRIPCIPPSRLGGVALYGAVQTGLMYILNYIGVANTTATKTSVITAASAFFAVILAPLFFRGEKLTALKVLGAAVGMAGIVLVNSSALGGFAFMGEGILLISSLLNTVGGFIGKKVSKGMVYESTAYQLTIGAAMILITGLVMGGSFTLTPESAVTVLYLAFVSAAAFTLWTALLVYHEADRILVFNMLIPVTGAVWSYVILGERQILEPLYIVSAFLTATGIIMVNYRPKNCIKN